MSLKSKISDTKDQQLELVTTPTCKNTTLLTAAAILTALSYVTAAYSLINTNSLMAHPTKIICCLGFFPASLLMTRAVTSSWKSRGTFCLAVSSVNALIATIIINYCDSILGHVYLSLSTAGTICYYKSFADDVEESEEGAYEASALVFCYMACVVPLWTQMARANLIQIVLNGGIMYFLTHRPTAILRVLAFLVIILSSLYLMCTSYGPAGGIHLVLMATAAELTIDTSKFSRLGEKKNTHDTLAFLCFICGLATLGVALNASQPKEFLTFYMAVFLSLVVNAMSASRYSHKLVHMVHTLLWSWLVSVYMMDTSYHHGIIHAMLSVTTICIYSEMDLQDEDPTIRETPLRYIASTACTIGGLITIDIWSKFVLNQGHESDNIITLSIMAGLFQILFCFAPLCVLDENHDNKIGYLDAVLLFLGVASIQMAAGLAQVYYISYCKGLIVLALSLGSVGLCWLEYLQTHLPEGAEESLV